MTFQELYSNLNSNGITCELVDEYKSWKAFSFKAGAISGVVSSTSDDGYSDCILINSSDNSVELDRDRNEAIFNAIMSFINSNS